MSDPVVERTGDRNAIGAGRYTPLLVFAVVFGASLFGIYTRPVGFLANLWPANAIMLALMLRVPGACRWSGWLAGAAAYLAADLLTGANLLKALLLNGANLAGVATAFAIYARLPADMARLRQPSSMLCLVLAAAAGGAVAGLVGSLANPMLFGRAILAGWIFWFATELVNYVAILPVLLSAPPLSRLAASAKDSFRTFRVSHLLPVAALILSCLLAATIGGPGAIAFPVPALLWCGLIYRLFPTALLTLLYSIWALVVLAAHHVTGADEEMVMVSIRLGAALVAIAPVTVASIAQNRNDLLEQLRHIADRDDLTATRSRRAFLGDVRRALAAATSTAAMLMIDIDYFKAINDSYGHAAGDRLLQSFARRVEGCLRPGDVFGRMGGEEFAIFLPATNEQEAARIAGLILAALRESPFALDAGQAVEITASIGVAATAALPATALEVMLADADAALYRAKDAGRDRWEYPAPAGTGRTAQPRDDGSAGAANGFEPVTACRHRP